MRILLDHGTPVPLRRALAGHSVGTAHEQGWATLTNGELLAAAEGSFDVLVTTDQNLRYQQNLTGRRPKSAVEVSVGGGQPLAGTPHMRGRL